MGLADAVRRAFSPSKLKYSDEELKIFSSSKYIGAAVSSFAVLGVIGIAIACLGLALDPSRPQSAQPGVVGDLPGISFWTIFGTDFVIGSAAAICGGLLGFIFGIPRTESRNAVAGAALQGDKTKVSSAALATNTNLERVSDWLTTILIGATLVQLKEVPGWIKGIASYASGDITNKTLLPFVIVYFAGLSFLGVYLVTRLYLTTALTQALGLVGADPSGALDPLIIKLRAAARDGTPAALSEALSFYDAWPNDDDKTADDVLIALSQGIAKYLAVGADNPAHRFTQLKSVFAEAVKDAFTREELAAQMQSKDLTTGDDNRDKELTALLQAK
jgi:hypothetical protein